MSFKVTRRKRRKMDNKEVQRRFSQLVERYGQELPNPLQEPRRFEYYVKLYTWHEELQKLVVDSKTKG